MGIKQTIKTAVIDWQSNYFLLLRRKSETNKFRDPRRVKIAESFPLSKEQREQIDQLYMENYGEKVDYVWHQNYAAHAGHFDYRFIPELLYIPEFESFQNQNNAAVRMMSDKNFLPLVAKAAGVRMPRTIVSCTNGLLRDGESNIITPVLADELVRKQGSFFVKPSVDSCSGQGCMRVDDADVCNFNGNALTFRDLSGGGYFRNYVCQELVTCHDSIRKIYSGSVNTFRVISYLWHDKVELMPIIIRIGQGGKYLDNAHAGGMFCAVYDDGRMGSHAVTEFNDQFTEHPDTHLIFANHRIEYLYKITAAAKKMHSMIPQIGVINWDFTINEKGEAVLIESNVKSGSVWLPQMAHGTGPFFDKTEEVLQWLRFMKCLKPHERCHFVGGWTK